MQTSRRGFTLIELMLSMTLMMMVFAMALPFFRIQSKAVEANIGRGEASQSARFVQSGIDRELRLAGGEVGQPLIVQATPWAVTFNVDLVSRVADDANAVYINVDADSLEVTSWRQVDAKALPTGSKVYPSRDYSDGSGNLSGAETITYFVLPDASSGRTDLYAVWRRVNDRDSTLVARDIHIPADTGYFFRYWRTTASGALTQIPTSSLPLYWDAASALADSIRVVDMRVSALWVDDRTGDETTRTTYASTRLLNAGLLKERTCGTAPLPARNVLATLQYDADGAPVAVRITWDNSLEEASGERDVSLYVVQRRLAAETAWTTLRNTSANGDAAYAFDDFDLGGGTRTYGVFSQDCSPSNSPVVSSAAVVIP
ncbi:MAG: prepilin-type N-terminal cleavage/methylation domain-containing protein [Gemmatimonadaceae bacterium]